MTMKLTNDGHGGLKPESCQVVLDTEFLRGTICCFSIPGSRRI